MPFFRFVEEGSGGTFRIDDPMVPYIGTFECMTCVGVAFRVSQRPCFVAHMAGYSAITVADHVVSKEAGRRVRRQVRSRMQEFFEDDNWDPNDRYFMSQFCVVCPERGPLKEVYTIGKYVLEGLQDFLHACARLVREQAFRLKNSNQTEYVRLKNKADYLSGRANALFAHVERRASCHGFAFNFATGDCRGFGRLEETNTIKRSDLGRWIDWLEGWGNRPPWDKCVFGVGKDGVDRVPDVYLAPPKPRIKMEGTLMDARLQFPMNKGALEKIDEIFARPVIVSSS